MFNESENKNVFEIRNRKLGESSDEYIEYLSSLLKYIKDESLTAYLLDIINSLKSQKKILSETGNSIIHDINGALEKDDEKTIEEIIGEKLIYFQNLLRGKSKIKLIAEEDPNNIESLDDIRNAYAKAPGNTMGQNNTLHDANIGYIIRVTSETITYDNPSMEGLCTHLDTSDVKKPFIIDDIIYYERKEIDGQLKWVKMEMTGNIQEVFNDYDMRVFYNPSQYCKICHIFQCMEDGQIIPSGLNGYIHSCEYELLNAKEDEEELEFAA